MLLLFLLSPFKLIIAFFVAYFSKLNIKSIKKRKEKNRKKEGRKEGKKVERKERRKKETQQISLNVVIRHLLLFSTPKFSSLIFQEPLFLLLYFQTKYKAIPFSMLLLRILVTFYFSFFVRDLLMPSGSFLDLVLTFVWCLISTI